jgi:hypothetical protein
MEKVFPRATQSISERNAASLWWIWFNELKSQWPEYHFS